MKDDHRNFKKLFLGLPMWANPDWRGSLYASQMEIKYALSEYASVFSAVEGNTTFYSGPPKMETVRAWANSVPEHFRFCFKLPSSMTHQKRLSNIEDELNEFLEHLSPLNGKLGPVMIQLPRDFGTSEMDKLEALLNRWPSHIPCSVEPREMGLFDKQEVEKSFNRLLITYQVDRVLLDVRPLFSTINHNDVAVIEAQKEKPKRPLHVISTGMYPIIRFIGHTDMAINDHFFTPWIKRIGLWISQGKTPFLFVHTADNKLAPLLARRCLERLSSELGESTICMNTLSFPGERQEALF